MSPEKKGYGLMVGLEIHQQLLTSEKLFCACPPVKSEMLPFSFVRRLRPAQSELGRVDPAAIFEFTKGKSNLYLWSPESSCLVEADEEPPHRVNPQAMDEALVVSLTMGSNVVDEVHVMRKIVIDGSNTTGFQRTAVVGLGGEMEVDGVKVGVQTVTLEEDAARILGEDPTSRRFALDRLGIPLVEVALAPVSGTPEFVGKVALHLGRVLRSTGLVARGLGTIRQDLNVSVSGGTVIEVKGVQKLNLVSKVVAYEARRQSGLVELAEKLRERGHGKVICKVKDVSDAVVHSSSRVLREQVAGGGRVLCIVASGLAGLVGWEPSQGIRLGRELAEVARTNSLGGVIHSDEFGHQGISGGEESILRKEVGAAESDALVLLAGPADAAKKAARPLVERLESVARGVPAETRAATDDGETRYMRPRPGSERMYPETDITDIPISESWIAEIRRRLPEHWERTVENLARDYSLSRDLAVKIYDSEAKDAFLSLTKELGLEPSVIAATLVELPVRLTREGVPEDAVSISTLTEVLRAVDGGRVAKEAAPVIIRLMGTKSMSVSRAIESLGLNPADEKEIGRTIDSIIAVHAKLVEQRGEGAFSALMGEAMAELRGRADGANVSRMLREKLSEKVRQPKSPG